jgi:hypothetical protein
MWQEVNEVMSGPKLVCSGLCSAISRCMQEGMSGTYLFSYI